MTTRYRIQRDPLHALDRRGRRPARWTVYRGVPFRPWQHMWFQLGRRYTTHAGAVRAHLKAAVTYKETAND